MRLKTNNTDIYCNNCSYLVIAVDTEIERHIYCENCTCYVIIDLIDVKDDKSE